MGARLLNLPASFSGRSAMFLESDFANYTTAQDGFSSVLSDSGTVAVGDASGGKCVITPSDGSVADNDEGYIKSTNELFLFANNKPQVAEVLLQFTEANTDDANVAFGFMNAVAANSILDDGAGPAASFSGAVIYKVDGGTVWRCRSSIGSSYTDSISTSTAGGSIYQTLRIECICSNSIVEVTYWIGQVNQLASASTTIPHTMLIDSTTRKPIKHMFSVTSATEMNLFAGVKNGGANLETLNLLRLCGAQGY